MTEVAFQLQGEWIALNDLLKASGVASSGGAAKFMISQGEVKLDDTVETRRTKKVRAGQVVQLANHRITVHAFS